MRLTLFIWPPRDWFRCRVDNCVLDWSGYFGPLKLTVQK